MEIRITDKDVTRLNEQRWLYREAAGAGDTVLAAACLSDVLPALKRIHDALLTSGDKEASREIYTDVSNLVLRMKERVIASQHADGLFFGKEGEHV
jgi:tRNA C32,U32 (ribose-2'-O)-methylase TrmJ